MSQAKAGDTVRIHYTGTLKTGETFDSSEGRDPLEFVVGSGQIIPGLDAVIPGLAEGDKKTVEIACEQAYGPINPEARQPVPKAELPDDLPTAPGTQLQMQAPNGQAIPVTIVEENDTEIMIDANHPLAGKDLTFAIEIVSITPAA